MFVIQNIIFVIVKCIFVFVKSPMVLLQGEKVLSIIKMYHQLYSGIQLFCDHI